MKTLIEKYWQDMHDAIVAQDKTKILQNFAPNAVYKYREPKGIEVIALNDMVASCLGYKESMDGGYTIEQVDELADGRWVSVITSSVNKTPYMATSYFKFEGGKIVELLEYYADLI